MARIEDEVYELRLSLEKQLNEIKKLLIPLSLYYSEKLLLMKGGIVENDGKNKQSI